MLPLRNRKAILSLAVIGLLVAAIVGFRAISKRKQQEMASRSSVDAGRKSTPADLRINPRKVRLSSRPMSLMATTCSLPPTLKRRARQETSVSTPKPKRRSLAHS